MKSEASKVRPGSRRKVRKSATLLLCGIEDAVSANRVIKTSQRGSIEVDRLERGREKSVKFGALRQLFKSGDRLVRSAGGSGGN